MPSWLDLSIKELNQYFAYIGRSDALATTYETPQDEAGGLFAMLASAIGDLFGGDEEEDVPEGPTADQIREANQLIMDITNGGVFVKDLISNGTLQGIDGIESIIKIYYGDTGQFGATDLPAFQPANPATSLPYEIATMTGNTVVRVKSDGSTEASIERDDTDTAGDSVDVGVNVNLGNPNKFSTPTLAAIVLPRLESAICTRNADALALFMNAIPTLQMSMCAPYLDIRVITDTPMIGTLANPGEGAINDMSMVRFLGTYHVNGADTDNFDFALASASPKEIKTEDPLANLLSGIPGFGGGEETEESNDPQPNISNAGMELFTMPQTLVNPLINTGLDRSGASRKASGFPDVLDPMQPFVTLKSVKIRDQLSGKGMIGFTKADIEIVLHDRSRMPELATFMNPQTFSLGSMIMEFGWSHPHAFLAETRPQEHQNPYANFLNSLRRRQKFKLIKSDFTLSDDGQVHITLSMQAMGGPDLAVVHIAEGKFVSGSTVKGILSRVVAQLMQSIEFNVKHIEVLPKQVLKPVTSLTDGTLLPKSILVEAVKILQHRKAEDATSSLTDFVTFIEKMIGDGTEDNQGEEVADPSAVAASIAAEVEKKLNTLDPKASSTADPWLVDIDTPLVANGYPQHKTKSEGSGTGEPAASETNEEDGEKEVPPGPPYVSLAKVVMNFVGKPLASTHKYDEVQCLFYGFNVLAGPMADYSIANFPISLPQFSAKLREMLPKKGEEGSDGNVQMLTVARMMSILSKIVSNPQADPYGFTDAYGSNYDTAESGTTATTVPNASSARMAEMKLLRTEFQAPSLKFWVETVPDISVTVQKQVGETDAGTAIYEDVKKPSGKEICRVHVYDDNAHPYFGTQTLLDVIQAGGGVAAAYTAAREDAEATADALKEGQTGNKARAASQLTKLVDDGIVKVLDNADGTMQVFKQNIDTETVKNFIKSQTPTITYGTQFSPITSLSVQSSTSGPTNNALIGRALLAAKGKGGSSGAGSKAPDMMVTPATINVKVLGCPIIGHGQYIYLDLGTGTTADNMYVVTGVEHIIEPGTFVTSFKLTYAGNKIESFRNQMGNAYVVLKDSGLT
jgi:hypothetical protein